MKNSVLTVILLLLGFLASAQTLQQRYLNAKELYREGKFGLARGAFQSISAENNNNPFVEYASYFYALSSYQEGYHAHAKDMLLQMKSRFANWEKIDDVNYWLAKIEFEAKNYEVALKYANSISDKTVRQDARNMKIHFLNQINDIDSLVEILKSNPTDSVTGRIIADKIHEQPFSQRDTQLLNDLVKRFRFNKNKYEIAIPEKSAKKGEYKVAVLLPFMYKEFSGSSANRKNFVYELYEGIKLAGKDLNSRGANIKLYAYDTRKDSSYTRQLLAMDELKGMDLIIGPISSEAIDVASTFSYSYRINMINPVSTNSQAIGRNPYSFLLLPSLETQAKKAAEFAIENFRGNPTSLILYGESQKDSILAHNYRKTLLDNGFSIFGMRKVRKQEEKNLFTLLTNTKTSERNDTKAELVIPRDTIGHIYVASDSDDEMIATYLISALETRSEYITIIGHEEWLEYSSIVPEQLERLQVHMVAPTFINYKSSQYKQFREKYLSETYSLPTKFSGLGYDMMMLFGNFLQQYGVHFQVNFDDAGFKNGIIFPGYLYDTNQDNQYVPIIKFIDSEVENVNQPSR